MEEAPAYLPIIDAGTMPGLDDVLAAISEFRKDEWQYTIGTDVDEYVAKMTKAFRDRFSYIPDMYVIHHGNKPLVSSMYRARAVDTFTDIRLICEHSYRPLCICTELQRANFPHHPVFYASSFPYTALLETIKAHRSAFESREYCISKWRIGRWDQTKIALYLFESYSREGSTNPESDALELLKEGFRFSGTPTRDQLQGFYEYCRFLHNSFLDDSSYSISAFLAHKALYSSHTHRPDMLLYPSVETKFKMFNFAVHPNYVDQNMTLDRACILRVNKVTDDDIIVGKIVGAGVIEEGSTCITWAQDENRLLELAKGFEFIQKKITV